jgi:hypothetical protein
MRFIASYSGTLVGREAELHGAQVWKVEGRELNRNCSIKLSR